MAFKFPFTNYHELNLTWVLDQLKKLFEESAENVTVIKNYNGRLTAVETEMPLVSETAQGASQTAANAASLAQTAKSTADTAQENAIQAQGLAGQARQEAQAAQNAADAATQAAQQAQSVAQNFDGRITEAQNNAAEALEASRSFENRVQAAITTANNAAQTATNAQGIATRADQNAASALDTLNSQRSELERIGAEQAALITEETESGKTEIENLAQSVLDSIPSDYTALSNLVDKKAPVIINSASGAVASFNDGADNMKIQKLVVNIEPIQAGSGDPSPDNIRPISGRTGAEIEQRGANLLNPDTLRQGDYNNTSVTTRVSQNAGNRIVMRAGVTYTVGYETTGSGAFWLHRTDTNNNLIGNWIATGSRAPVTYTASAEDDGLLLTMIFAIKNTAGGWNTCTPADIAALHPYVVIGSVGSYEPYTGNQISATFPSEAGTVYGGTLTLNPDRMGTLVVNRASVDLGTLTWNNNGNYWYNNSLVSVMKINGYNEYSPIIAEKYATSYPSRIINKTKINIIANYSAALGGLMVYTGDNTTAPNGRIVYELATPIEYQLTAEQVSGILSTLYGTNNVWANTGDIQTCDYPADTKLYIDGKIAELQATILENI